MRNKRAKPNNKKQESNGRTGTADIKELIMSHKLSIAKWEQRKIHIVKRSANDEYQQRKKQLA